MHAKRVVCGAVFFIAATMMGGCVFCKSNQRVESGHLDVRDVREVLNARQLLEMERMPWKWRGSPAELLEFQLAPDDFQARAASVTYETKTGRVREVGFRWIQGRCSEEKLAKKPLDKVIDLSAFEGPIRRHMLLESKLSRLTVSAVRAVCRMLVAPGEADPFDDMGQWTWAPPVDKTSFGGTPTRKVTARRRIGNYELEYEVGFPVYDADAQKEYRLLLKSDVDEAFDFFLSGQGRVTIRDASP